MENDNIQKNMYLKNLEEEVYQFSNVVTYKWLVRTLKVSANVAKRILFEFVEKKKLDGIHLNVSYFVAGEKFAQEENIPIHEISIVPSSQLEAAKARFKVVTSLHVYAVHKIEIKDFHSVLYAVDYSPKQNRVTEIKNGCAIESPNVALRHDNGHETLNLPESPQIVSHDKKNPDQSKEQNPKFAPIASNGKKMVKSKGHVQGASLVGMFKNMGKKKNDKKTDEDVMDERNANRIVEKYKEPGEKAKREGKCNIFSTNAGSTERRKKSSEDSENTKNEQIKEDKNEVREKRKAKTVMYAKKRRRIIQMSESSSEEESDPEDPIPTPRESSDEEPIEEVAETRVQNSDASGRKSVHKRKLVKESGLDEEGFLVTQNNWKVGSGSEDSANENEDPIPKTKPDKQTKKEEPENKNKKVTPKSKQVSLTNFFKKK